MSESLLALEWLGGATERRLRRARPDFDDLPWESVEERDPEEMLEARVAWTNGVFTEYASAAAFSAMNIAFLECRAPVDLCAAAADFALDELVHVTLSSRLVMALGGATPFLAPLEVAPAPSASRPLLRAAELAIKVSCVGEALSLPSLAASHRGTTQPLARAVLERLRHDEGPHAAIGFWFLDWAPLTDADREHLGRVAREAIAVYETLWLDPVADARTVPDRDGPVSYRDFMERAVEERIVARLAPYGIEVNA